MSFTTGLTKSAKHAKTKKRRGVAGRVARAAVVPGLFGAAGGGGAGLFIGAKAMGRALRGHPERNKKSLRRALGRALGQTTSRSALLGGLAAGGLGAGLKARQLMKKDATDRKTKKGVDPHRGLRVLMGTPGALYLKTKDPEAFADATKTVLREELKHNAKAMGSGALGGAVAGGALALRGLHKVPAQPVKTDARRVAGKIRGSALKRPRPQLPRGAYLKALKRLGKGAAIGSGLGFVASSVPSGPYSTLKAHLGDEADRVWEKHRRRHQKKTNKKK